MLCPYSVAFVCSSSGVIHLLRYLFLAFGCFLFCFELALFSFLSFCLPSLGTAFGAYEISEALGAFIGHPLIGLIRDRTGDYHWPLRFFTLLSVAACVLSILLICLDTTGILQLPTQHEGPHMHHHCTDHKHERSPALTAAVAAAPSFVPVTLPVTNLAPHPAGVRPLPPADAAQG